MTQAFVSVLVVVGLMGGYALVGAMLDDRFK